MDIQWTIAITEALDFSGEGDLACFSVRGSQSSCHFTFFVFLFFAFTAADDGSQH